MPAPFRARSSLLSVRRPQLVASDTFGGRQRSNACVRKVFEHVWNEVHGDGAHDPSFNWDDATNAMVGGDRKFGNWDDGAMAGTRRKFGLMIKNGSEGMDMAKLDGLTVTREGDSTKGRADDVAVNVHDHIFRHDRITPGNPDPAGDPPCINLKVVKQQQKGEPKSVILVDGRTLPPPRNAGSSEAGWSIHRNRVRPSGKASGLDQKLLVDGLESCDVSTLVDFLAEDYALGLSSWLKEPPPPGSGTRSSLPRTIATTSCAINVLGCSRQTCGTSAAASAAT